MAAETSSTMEPTGPRTPASQGQVSDGGNHLVVDGSLHGLK